MIYNTQMLTLQDLTTDKVLAVGQRHQGLYKFKAHISNGFNQFSSSSSINATSVVPSIDIVHARLGHSSFGKLKHFPLSSLNNLNDFTCESCILAKHHKMPFHESKSIASDCFAMLHMDLWGPYKTPTLTGAK